jgi:hypothetical protein
MAVTDVLQSPLSVVAAISFLFYIVIGALYRLYLSPIAKFPGPRLAALSLWYEFWFDAVKRGQYTFRIAEMHEKYGTYTSRFADVNAMKGPQAIPRSVRDLEALSAHRYAVKLF